MNTCKRYVLGLRQDSEIKSHHSFDSLESGFNRTDRVDDDPLAATALYTLKP